MTRTPFVLMVALLAALVACGSDDSSDPLAADAESAAHPALADSAHGSGRGATSAASTGATEPVGDAGRGKKLVEQFQCQRCHDGLDGVAPIAEESHCTHCHQQVMLGKFRAKPDNARWQRRVAHLTQVPSLAAAGSRLRYDWVVEYLMNPRDLRPNLVMTMPRLPLSREQARDIAAFLMTLANKTARRSLDGADQQAGRAVIDKSGCGKCHQFSGAPALPDSPHTDAPSGGKHETRTAVMLAPDWRFARQQLQTDTMVSWLLDPLAVKHGTQMPQTPMTEQDARNVAGYIIGTVLEPVAAPTLPTPLPLLDRHVGYDEVHEKVLGRTCTHCHGNPEIARGDGGPGNTGGLGFKGRGLALFSYEHIMAGYTDDKGERRSVFAQTATGQPRLVASLLARYAEEAGTPNPDVRGMPLGLPPLSLEDIQLVASWVAQGRPR